MKANLKDILNAVKKSTVYFKIYPVFPYKSFLPILYTHFVEKFLKKGTIWNLSIMDDENMSKLLEPPSCVRGMKVLDRKLFDKELDIPSVTLSPEKAAPTIKVLKRFFLKLRNFSPVQEDQGNKVIYLNPLLIKGSMQEIQNFLERENIAHITSKKVRLSYDNWHYDNIFKAVLPPDIPGVAGFTIIGHIIHLNLKEHFDDYKYLIGQVFLDKKPNIKTVVNKVNNIENTFRNFNMEVLAGEHNLQVSIKENGHKYEFDFSEVFWNSRLSTEHRRIVNVLNSDDVLFDVFAGVGPFAIPAAKKGCHVYANDLNPHSFKWLCHNAKLNKVDSQLQTFNMDGRDFICNVIRDKLKEMWQDKKIYPVVNIAMNLPSFSFTFLDAFKNMFSYYGDDIQKKIVLPVIICYFFLRKDAALEDAVNEIERIFECKMQHNILEKTFVRAVSSSKDMMCITFKLPEEVLFYKNEQISEPLPKKLKLGI